MKTREELRRDRDENDLKQVMSTEGGRRFVWRQLSNAGLFTTSFVAGAGDLTAFNEGGRCKGLQLLNELMRVCPGSYLTMQKESMDNEQRERIEDQLDQRKRLADDGSTSD